MSIKRKMKPNVCFVCLTVKSAVVTVFIITESPKISQLISIIKLFFVLSKHSASLNMIPNYLVASTSSTVKIPLYLAQSDIFNSPPEWSEATKLARINSL